MYRKIRRLVLARAIPSPVYWKNVVEVENSRSQWGQDAAGSSELYMHLSSVTGGFAGVSLFI